MKGADLLILIAFCSVLLYASLSLPGRGEVKTPPHQEESLAGSQGAGAYYIKNAYKDAHTPNMVTVVLADYRSFDTLGETIVVFTAGLAAYLILRRRP